MKLFDSAVYIAMITGYLYCSSTAHTHGYLKTLGLDTNILDRNFHQIIYDGLILNIGVFLLVPTVILGTLFIHSTYKTSLSDYLYRNFTNGRKFVRLKKKLKCPTKKQRPIHRKYIKRVNLGFVLALIMIVIVVLLVRFESKGNINALATIQSIEEDGYQSISVNIENQEFELVYLYCGIRICAGYDVVSQKIRYFPQNGHSFNKKLLKNTK